MEPDDDHGQQLSTFYLFPVLKDFRLHSIFIYAFACCLAYGCWLYISRYIYDGHYQKIKLHHLVRPSDITTPFEGDLSRTLTRSDHWTLHGLAWMKKNILQSSITPKVLIGREGWLFLQEEDGRKVTQQSLGVYQYAPDQLKTWALNIRQRHFWAQKYGMDYVLVIAPNKSTIYPEFLPLRFQALDQTRSREQLIRALPEIPIIDLTDSIKKYKQEGLLYYKTDTHWNALGAYFGYRALVRSLPAPYSAIPMLQNEINNADTKVRSGDLGRMSLDGTNSREAIRYLVPENPKARAKEERTTSDGQTVNTLVYHQADTSLPSVFFDHDSYFKDLEPLFAEHFSESTFLWGFQDFHADLIRKKNVDLIVDEFVERALIGPTPRHEWPVVQEYWGEFFTTLPVLTQLHNLSFEQLIPQLQRLDIPEGKLPILKISTQPEQTDKLVIDYGNEQGYYWLRAEGDVYYLQYDPEKIKNFRVENNTPCRIEVEVSLY